MHLPYSLFASSSTDHIAGNVHQIPLLWCTNEDIYSKNSRTILSDSQKRLIRQSRVTRSRRPSSPVSSIPCPFIILDEDYLPIMDDDARVPYSIELNRKNCPSGYVLFTRTASASLALVSPLISKVRLRYLLRSSVCPKLLSTKSFAVMNMKIKKYVLKIFPPLDALFTACGRHPTIGWHSFIYPARSAPFQDPMTLSVLACIHDHRTYSHDSS